MTVRLTPRGYPGRTMTVGGVQRLEGFYRDDYFTKVSQGEHQDQLLLVMADGTDRWFPEIGEIELDDAPGDWW